VERLAACREAKARRVDLRVARARRVLAEIARRWTQHNRRSSAFRNRVERALGAHETSPARRCDERAADEGCRVRARGRGDPPARAPVLRGRCRASRRRRDSRAAARPPRHAARPRRRRARRTRAARARRRRCAQSSERESSSDRRAC
jgi:hypothetical protein